MKFTIVMTVFQKAEMVPRALFSVTQQTHKNWELLIVTDGPHPKVKELVATFKEKAKLPNRIEYEELPRMEGTWGNPGRRHGMNMGEGDYLVYLSHDCLWTPDYLAAHARNIEAHGDCFSLVSIQYWTSRTWGCPFQELSHIGRVCDFMGRMPNKSKHPSRLEIAEVDLGCMCFPMSVARKIPIFPVMHDFAYQCDWYAFEECRKRLPVAFSPDIVGAHF